MPWIAKTSGATSGQVAELREGVLADIPAGDRANWREVDENHPGHDANTHSAAITGLPIAGDGTVSAQWATAPLPAALAKLRLEQLALSVMLDKLNTGLITIGQKQVAIRDGFLVGLKLQRDQITAGAPTVSVQTADGDIIDVTGAQLDAGILAIHTARHGIAEARKTIVAAIRAGTVTTSNSVRNHASWPV
ncbi:MAG TPA: hypothetical protein PKA33_01670 [Amaricoccus sp.]|uniref:hypothetical protein n=1 Tax=Amaricoccus sp. TaxID=1872485 RepID=UPI002CCB44AA|nr:hypothetical protein [Amaricoccus sp.]HMQ39065.1 hypothetical protein [Micropruina sp.]HMR23471.1 hypothetical protein [Micropruina sp.]HMR51196.1 hypothetical protein [Amaricoccus sp.]HMT98055.1 hypothetical protein [Amaricoccus sp.]